MAFLPTAKDGARDDPLLQSQCPAVRATGGLLFIVQFQAQAVVPWGTAALCVKQLANTECGILPSQVL